MTTFADDFCVVWEHIGKDWKNLLEEQRKNLREEYEVLFVEVLRPYRRPGDDQVELVWVVAPDL